MSDYLVICFFCPKHRSSFKWAIALKQTYNHEDTINCDMTSDSIIRR